jgi:hypothetical protein
MLSVLVAMLIPTSTGPRDRGITEGAGSILQLRDTLGKQPPGTFDRWCQPQSGGVSSGLRSGAS